jgi:3-deoxy-D-manno-octulosonate 8-phosphate phosphatase (KDO 8-P phosphatase)
MDVDGTLTDGTVIYGNENMELKAFNTRDGAILKALPQLGISTVFLTGRESEAVKRRAFELGALAVQGMSDKASMLYKLLDNYSISPDQVAYIGDDVNDYKAMSLCGFKACPADAVKEIKDLADYISPFSGGHGAVRDVIEKIIKESGKWEEFLSLYNFGMI